MRIQKRYYILSLLLFGMFNYASAQRDTTLNREVEVTKEYNPTISDADKINDMPKINEEEPKKPAFNYSIFSQPISRIINMESLI